MRADTKGEFPPESVADLPLQPTGSGVADLEIAYEQMKLAEDATTDVGADEEPVGGRSAENEEVEAHPS